nr:unnamed protein product [Digitaria exilis]
MPVVFLLLRKTICHTKSTLITLKL